MKTERIILIGLERSGTTWVGGLLRDNFTERLYERGKHSVPQDFDKHGEGLIDLPGNLFVVIYKELSMWLKSIGRNDRWFSDRHPNLKNELDLAYYYHYFYHRWGLLERSRDIHFIPYESILIDPIEFLDRLQQCGSLERKHTTWKLDTKRGASTRPWTKETKQEYIDNYLKVPK